MVITVAISINARKNVVRYVDFKGEYRDLGRGKVKVQCTLVQAVRPKGKQRYSSTLS
jgi:hypothetical protein